MCFLSYVKSKFKYIAELNVCVCDMKAEGELFGKRKDISVERGRVTMSKV